MQVCKTLRQLIGKIIVKTSSNISEVKAFKKTEHLEREVIRPNQLNLSSFLGQRRFPTSDFGHKSNRF